MLIAPTRVITSESTTPAPKLPPYLLIALIVLLCSTAISAGVVALARTMIPPSNLLASYTDIFPGQPRSAVESRGFLCLKEIYEYLLNEFCFINPPTGAFSQIDVFASEGVIDQIKLRPHANALTVGDLMLLRGKPVVQEYSLSVYLDWRGDSVFAIASHDSGRFSLLLPVRRIIIGIGSV